jgi:hypothetical protein
MAIKGIQLDFDSQGEAIITEDGHLAICHHGRACEHLIEGELENYTIKNGTLPVSFKRFKCAKLNNMPIWDVFRDFEECPEGKWWKVTYNGGQ